MTPYFVKTPKIIRHLFSDATWKIATGKKEIYLTFDDGPIPAVTPWVLQTLAKYQAKASFFCVGDNIKKHPDIFQDIIQQDHSVGNHTFNHLNGWKTITEQYLDNIEKAEDLIRRERTAFKNRLQTHEAIRPQPNKSKLFRPPYGKIKPNQSKLLNNQGYQIIMWDVLSADYHANVSPKKCLENVTKNAQNGSIIVFHDNKKAWKNLEYTLPRTLAYFQERGFVFKAL